MAKKSSIGKPTWRKVFLSIGVAVAPTLVSAFVAQYGSETDCPTKQTQVIQMVTDHPGLIRTLHYKGTDESECQLNEIVTSMKSGK